METSEYESRVQALEAEGMTRSDAQGVALGEQLEATADMQQSEATVQTVAGYQPMTLERFTRMYLDWVNNFVTVERFADHYAISERVAREIIAHGRAIHSIDLDAE